MGNWFRQLFKSQAPEHARDKFLARLFGIFSEEIVRIWCASPRSRYEDLGRPRVIAPGSKKAHTFDFTLRSKRGGRCYVSEMKCWVEYQGYRHLTLHDAKQLQDLEGSAFDTFLAAAVKPSKCQVTVSGDPQPIDGAVLIWGDVAGPGRESVQARYRLAEILSLRDLINDLVRWEDTRYAAFLKGRARWCHELFRGLAAAGR